MFFRIDPTIFQRHPDCVIGVIVAHNVHNSASSKKLVDLLKKRESEIRSGLTLEKIAHHPQVTAWHEAYKQFGANPKKYLPSIENLLRRIVQGHSIAGINTLVDLYNLASLRYLVPAGGEDLDTIQGDIQLAIASNSEPAILLLGDKEPHAPKKGEIFYKDDNGAICRRWNWKEAARTKLTPDTKNALLVLEGLTPVNAAIMSSALHELASFIQEYCGGVITFALLDKNTDSIEIAHQGEFGIHRAPTVSKSEPYHDPLETKISSAYITPSVVLATEESSIRRKKVEALRAQGIEPWPTGRPVDMNIADFVDEFLYNRASAESVPKSIAGRIVSMRGHGKAVFAHLQDGSDARVGSGKIQLYIKQDIVGEDQFKLWQQFIDIGDIVWCKGVLFLTKTGEVTLQVAEFFLESKSLHPLPDKFHGIADIEMKYRQRYLDLISDPVSRQRFYDRSKIVRRLRETFDAHGFMEVETPMLHPIPGGAAARPFVTHHNTLDMQLYLRIAPELYLKRLVVGGFERVYEINRNFRNEGVSTRHNPEFTMLECYVAYKDYMWMMDFLENLIRTVALAVCGGIEEVPFRDKMLNLGAPFTRMTMAEAVAQTIGCSEADLTDGRIDVIAQQHGITRSAQLPTRGHMLYALFDKLVEPHLWQPTFITDFPSVVSPLAKRKPSDPELTDRFELFVANMELANGFNELNDPDDQAARFKEQVAARETGDAEAHHYDAEYVRALEYALPPTVGAGIGIDRLAMLLTDAHSIKDVILFPTMRSATLG